MWSVLNRIKYNSNNAMRILELCANYPGPREKAALSYVKTRNHYYRDLGISDITVLNFTVKGDNYIEDGFKVISLAEYRRKYTSVCFDLLVCHAPNLRNHYLFLRKFHQNFKKIIFFFHGHEVLSINKEYPKPYSYMKTQGLSRYISPYYDYIKFRVWKKYFQKQTDNVTLVFVSKWIANKFEEYLGLSLNSLSAKHYIIQNGISRRFENESYDVKGNKEYDFITIRSNLDDSKYAIDVVNNLANRHPQYKFLLVGKGHFFEHYAKADNIIRIERFITPDEMVALLNKSRYGLMPTKNDTQGIMACEMATFGIPLVTSDLDVCKIVFEGFNNVAFINNDNNDTDLNVIISTLSPAKDKNEKFFFNNTIVKEVSLFKKLSE